MSEFEVDVKDPGEDDAVSKGSSIRPAVADTSPGEKPARKRVKAPTSSTECPRWMHHRPGVYCKTCGRST